MINTRSNTPHDEKKCSYYKVRNSTYNMWCGFNENKICDGCRNNFEFFKERACKVNLRVIQNNPIIFKPIYIKKSYKSFDTLYFKRTERDIINDFFPFAYKIYQMCEKYNIDFKFKCYDKHVIIITTEYFRIMIDNFTNYLDDKTRYIFSIKSFKSGVIDTFPIKNYNCDTLSFDIFETLFVMYFI